MLNSLLPLHDIQERVQLALQEDVGNGDLTAHLVPEESQATARVISREQAILCGQAWFDEVFRQLDPEIEIQWKARDGEPIGENQVLCELRGSSRELLTGERTALNFLQSLSGTATLARRYADAVAGTGTRVLDTRKTIPGLRTAQKYAVRCGGCHNHRMGLYDAILIKENHIHAAGSIALAVNKARKQADVTVEVEVETLDEVQQALNAGADILLLDNMDNNMLRKAVELNNGRAKLEASGGVNLHNIRAIAETGVDFISVGALTKDLHAIDLSMRFL